MDLYNLSGAIFSPCRRYRYLLWRYWDTSKPIVVFIGLNPSTANENTDDPTIRRVKAMAKTWGYGGVHMMNLFGIISSDPAVLVTCPDPIGENDKQLSEGAGHDIIFAWGSFPQATERAKVIIEMFPNAKALVINKDGSPRHPLYVPSTCQPIPFFSGTNRHQSNFDDPDLYIAF